MCASVTLLEREGGRCHTARARLHTTPFLIQHISGMGTLRFERMKRRNRIRIRLNRSVSLLQFGLLSLVQTADRSRIPKGNRFVGGRRREIARWNRVTNGRLPERDRRGKLGAGVVGEERMTNTPLPDADTGRCEAKTRCTNGCGRRGEATWDIPRVNGRGHLQGPNGIVDIQYMLISPATQELFHVHIDVVVTEFLAGLSEIKVWPPDVVLVEIELKCTNDEHKA